MITIKDLMYAEKLRIFREQKKIKQEDAASKVGYKGQQGYSDLENGKKPFTDEVIRQICEGFKITSAKFKEIDLAILHEMIHRANLPLEVIAESRMFREKEHLLHILECEKRIAELKLENVRKDKKILELQKSIESFTPQEIPKIYLMI